jgi:hypothetical protein
VVTRHGPHDHRADAARDRGLGLTHNLGQAQAESFEGRRSSVLVGLRQDQSELVASEPGHDVRRSKAIGQGGRDPSQQLVSGQVAVLVVDLLESVQIKKLD